ncbi:Transcriptional regulatory protein, C terminal [Terriglobus roseus]|uniref:Transcriptional regulatory protein, C terminal n=1 Tax=Terriglobus roseus TaxID=392734 RepID=A0A1H4JYE6_9BACT|nr:Transcriptional regulatory protein, C terminal [Terriglobus roseus]
MPAETERETEPGVKESLARMLASPQFARAETQRRLLHYLWERRHDAISEYAIATEALGRNSNFDSNSDASVRVQISRLRRKLKDYYLETGEAELLAIPTGTHQLTVLERQPLEVPVEARVLPPLSASDWVRARVLPLLVCLCLVLAVALGTTSIFLVRQIRKSHALAAQAPATPNAFWLSFLAGDAPIRIVLPTPVFFNFKNYPSLRLRSTEVNDFGAAAQNPELKAVIAKMGPVGLEQSYTVTWDTLAAIQIARYLDRIGEGKRVSFQVTRDSSLLSLEQANVIVLGTDHTLQPMHEYMESMNFTLIPGEERVLNARPEGNEPKAYVRQLQGEERHIEPSIIAVMPGRAPGLKVLMLESRDTSGMVSLLASNAGSHAVEEMWRAHGSPQFFEMVVMTEMEVHTPLRSWPVTMHAYTKVAPSKTL